MQSPYGHGAYQVLIRPPTRDKPVAFAVRKHDGDIPGLQVAGKRTDTGYTIEMLVPWSAFPAIKPGAGAEVGLQFALDDYDDEDGNTVQPVMFSYRGVKYLGNAPQRFIRWKLTETTPTGDAPLGPAVTLDVREAIIDARPVPIAVEVGRNPGAPGVASARLSVTDASGRRVLDKQLSMSPLPAPWGDSRGGRLNWSADSIPDGCYTVRAALLDKAGRAVGTAFRPVAVSRGTVEAGLKHLGAAKLGELAVKDPFRAAGWLAVGVGLERVKRAAWTGEGLTLRHGAQEMTARIDLLEHGRQRSDPRSLLDLLVLAADPQSQVVVELPYPDWGRVAFYCGAVPLVVAHVKLYESNEIALGALRFGDEDYAPPPGAAEVGTVAGSPARFMTASYQYEPVTPEAFSPNKHVLLVSNEGKVVTIMEAESFPRLRAEAVVVLPGCPAKVAERVKAWAGQMQLPIEGLEEAVKRNFALVAGDLFARPLPEKITKYVLHAQRVVKGFCQLAVVKGDRLIAIDGPSRGVCVQVAELVLAGKALKSGDVDALRRQLVKDLAPGKARPSGDEHGELFCGDLHSHTFYSDGSPSPAALSLQAVHCFLDFLVVSDHNTIDGAVMAANLFADHRVGFPVVVGEEITTGWIHMNAYPLKELIPWTLDTEESIKAAHAQGGVIQWNHPGFPGGAWDAAHQRTGLEGTGFDAWEHVVPLSFERWKAQGKLPVIVGGTDTHDGTFGQDRTLVLARSPAGKDLAEAIRSRQAADLEAYGSRLIYGSSEALLNKAWWALEDGDGLKKAKAERLKAYLKDADIPALIRASLPWAIGKE
jgi:predicted metal-dependent phosphoesterase TrpH